MSLEEHMRTKCKNPNKMAVTDHAYVHKGEGMLRQEKNNMGENSIMAYSTTVVNVALTGRQLFTSGRCQLASQTSFLE